jgi:hypothetical protein
MVAAPAALGSDAGGKLLFSFAASSAITARDIARDGSVAVAAEVSGRGHGFSVEGLIG